MVEQEEYTPTIAMAKVAEQVAAANIVDVWSIAAWEECPFGTLIDSHTAALLYAATGAEEAGWRSMVEWEKPSSVTSTAGFDLLDSRMYMGHRWAGTRLDCTADVLAKHESSTRCSKPAA